MTKQPRKRSGQAMLIAVLSLGGAMLGATTIAGLLILYQLRATTNSVDSSKSIFAADSGIEWALYDYYCGIDGRTPCPPAPLTQLAISGAAVSSTCYDVNNAATPCDSTTTVAYVVSKGSYQSAARAFYWEITTATTTFP